MIRLTYINIEIIARLVESTWWLLVRLRVLVLNPIHLHSMFSLKTTSFICCLLLERESGSIGPRPSWVSTMICYSWIPMELVESKPGSLPSLYLLAQRLNSDHSCCHGVSRLTIWVLPHYRVLQARPWC